MEEQEQEKIKIDIESLYKVTTYTDTKHGEIRKYTHVNEDGNPTISTKVFFVGSTHIMTPQGVIPLEFEIEDATDLKSAINTFPKSAENRIEEMKAEIQEALKKEYEEQLIITPDQMKKKMQTNAITT